MSDQDVKEHLSRYADWLQRSYHLELTPTGDSTVSIDPIVPIASPKRSWGRQVTLAAVAAAIVVVGAAAMLRNSSSGLVVAASDLDPAGPLYVLPEPLDTAMLRSAQVVEDVGPGVRFGSEIIIVGRPSGDGAYDDLATIWIGAQAPQLDTELEPLDLESGPAQAWDDIFTLVVQDREGTTIRVMADSDRVDYASTILDSMTIDGSGSASIDTDGLVEVIEAATFDDGTEYTSTYFEVASELTIDGEDIVVETATAPSPLLGAGALGGELSATRIQGVEGWKLTRLDVGGEWNGIAWQATPNRIIAVSGHAQLEVIQELAESLTIVSEDDWKTALPNYTTG